MFKPFLKVIAVLLFVLLFLESLPLFYYLIFRHSFVTAAAIAILCTFCLAKYSQNQALRQTIQNLFAIRFLQKFISALFYALGSALVAGLCTGIVVYLVLALLIVLLTLSLGGSPGGLGPALSFPFQPLVRGGGLDLGVNIPMMIWVTCVALSVVTGMLDGLCRGFPKTSTALTGLIVFIVPYRLSPHGYTLIISLLLFFITVVNNRLIMPWLTSRFSKAFAKPRT
jgi:hypothetical protein